MINMNIFVIILEFQMLNMQLKRFFKMQVEKIPESRLQVDDILYYFHFQVNICYQL
jgi:hypothetical protein